MNISILGCGLVGGPMVRDLAADGTFRIIAADRDVDRLQPLEGLPGVTTRQADLADKKQLLDCIADADLVINATPGFMGFSVFEGVIDAGKNIIDIAFFPEDPIVLDGLAKSKGVTAIMDMGVAPGLSNMLAAYAVQSLEATHRLAIYVGGLPVTRVWPFEYKAGFSPADVIEEYTRPARFVQNGRIETRQALSDPEFIDFPGIGTLEAFNSDGLRSLIQTLEVPDMIEKTLRYPGHIDKIRFLRECGFFSKKEITINGQNISPLDFTSGILFPLWKLGQGEEDITVMRIVAEGMKDSKPCRITYDLFDRYDPLSGVHSMARTTGYSATAAARMLLGGLFQPQGVIFPEFIPKEAGCLSFILQKLEERGIFIRVEETNLTV